MSSILNSSEVVNLDDIGGDICSNVENITLMSDDEDDMDISPSSRTTGNQNLDLIDKMLSLERPVFTHGMIEFLQQDEVCALFLNYIVRLENQTRIPDGPASVGSISKDQYVDRENTELSVALQKSYRATMLLSVQEPTEALYSFLGTKCKLITKCLFMIFQPDARGHFTHGCKVIDTILRSYINEVYDVIGKNSKTVSRYVGNMLEYIEYAPVAEVFLNLISKPHRTVSLRHYISTPSMKWKFFRSLSDWKLLVVLKDHICNEKFSEAHAIGASDVLLELLDRLVADDNGQLLLQPVAYCPELLNDLISVAVDKDGKISQGRRTAAIRCVLGFLNKCALEEVLGPPTSPYQSFGSTQVNMLPNQLSSIKETIYVLAESRIPDLVSLLVQQYEKQQRIYLSDSIASGKDLVTPLPETSVRHTSYVVKVPFTEFRLTVVDALVELLRHNHEQLNKIPLNLWRAFLNWFIEYGHTSLYHAAFYKLVFIGLRSNQKEVLEIFVKKLKLVTVLIDQYRKVEKNTSNRGYILMCCNAIRLQVKTLPPDSFLAQFLQSHETWRKFEEQLREDTLATQVKGLGFNVPKPYSYAPTGTESWSIVPSDGIDHGSAFAISLGFIDDVAWPVDDTGEEKKKKKKKKSRRKSKGRASEIYSSEGGDILDTSDGNANSTSNRPSDDITIEKSIESFNTAENSSSKESITPKKTKKKKKSKKSPSK